MRYLADVLVRVATHPASRVEELLPANCKKTVASHVVTNVAAGAPQLATC